MIEKDSKQNEEFAKEPNPSFNSYCYPFPEGTPLTGIEYDGPSHEGPYKGAVDFLVAEGTPVLAPQAGRVIEVVDNNNKYGPTEDYAEYLNYITLMHLNGEFSQVAHLGQKTALVKAGDIVEQGQIIATSGNSGWQTEPHIHMFIFTVYNAIENSTVVKKFEGKKIRFE